jgi:hypothetical protein
MTFLMNKWMKYCSFDEGLSLKNFIHDLSVDGGGYFIQCDVFQALPPKERRSQKLGQHRNLYICQIIIDNRDLPSPRPRGRRSQHLSDTDCDWPKLVLFLKCYCILLTPLLWMVDVVLFYTYCMINRYQQWLTWWQCCTCLLIA